MTASPRVKLKEARAVWPPFFDAQAYKGRSVAGRAFALDKQGLGLATGYHKLAVVYLGVVVLCAVVTWLKGA